MGQQLPQVNNTVSHLERKDFLESKYIQRIKQTPFIDAHLYNTSPLIFIEPEGLPLQSLIRPRIGTKQLFPQEEIEKLITGILQGLRDLQENGFEGHGDLSLETLYYSKRDKLFKLRHPKMNQQSGYLLAKHGKRFSFLSPEQLSVLSQEIESSEISGKSDLFAFGVVLCQICTLTPSADIYCPDTYSIFHLEIQKRIKLIEQYYSPKIVEFISDCLVYDPEERPSISKLIQKSWKEKGWGVDKKGVLRGVIYQ